MLLRGCYSCRVLTRMPQYLGLANRQICNASNGFKNTGSPLFQREWSTQQIRCKSMNPCLKALMPQKKKERKANFKSMWDIENCVLVKDCLAIPYDVEHYRITDKKKRKYQVTWNECPRLRTKPSKVCLFDQFQKTKYKRRCRNRCHPPSIVAEGMDCAIKVPYSGDCPRKKPLCGTTARIPPTCERVKIRVPCKKREAPYPSFSECKKEALTKWPPVECRCLELPMMCEVWAQVRRRVAMGLKPTPAGCGDP